MAPANLHLQRVFNEAFRQFDRERRSRFRPDLVDIEVKFYPYAGLHHTIRVRAGRDYVRLSDLLHAATPALTWSKRQARSILGHHDAAHETITISKTLDSSDVPAWFVEYIVFHEMLHIKHPARIINGRRYYHSPAFREEERSFPTYRKAQQWLDRVVRKRHEL